MPVTVISVMVVIFTFFTKRVVEMLVPAARKKKQVGDVDVGDVEIKAVKQKKALVSVSTYHGNFGRWWNEVILYAIPVFYGFLIALIGGSSDWLFPGLDTLSVKVMVGCGVGWFSSLFYKIIRKLVLKKTGVDIQPGSVTLPPSGAGT